MKTLTLKKEHAIAEFCSEDPTQPSICGVLYEKSKARIVATDGRRMLIVPAPEEEVVAKNLPAETMIIPKDAIKTALGKNIPVAVSQTVPLTAHITTTKGNVTHDMSFKVLPFDLPIIESVLQNMPNTPAKAEVILKPAYFRSFLDYAEKHSKSIKMEIWGNCDPVRFTIKTEVGDVVGILATMVK